MPGLANPAIINLLRGFIGYTQERIAGKLGESRDIIRNYLIIWGKCQSWQNPQIEIYNLFSENANLGISAK